VKLSELYDSLRQKNPEKMKLSFMKSQKPDLSQKKHEDLAQNIAYEEHILILTLYLPLKVQKTQKDFEISFLYDKPLYELESFLITRLLTHYKRMVWVGLLKDLPTNIDEKAIKELSDLVFEKFKCKVLFSPFNNSDWELYYKKIWNPMMRNQFDIQKINDLNKNLENIKDSVGQFQQWFNRKLEPFLEENSMVVILDSFLSFLSEGLFKKGLKVALYSQFGFPSIETLLLHVFSDDDLLKGFLNTHVLAFNSFKQAKRLIEAAENDRSFNWKIESERGSLNLSGKNRKIALKTFYPGLDANHLEQHLKKMPEYLNFYKDFSKELKGKKVLLCMEKLEDCKGVEQRLLFLKRFLIETSNKYKIKVLFLLKIKKNQTFLQDELFNIREIINKINNTVFNNPYESELIEDFATISLFESPFSKPVIATFMSLSSIFLVNSLSEESLLNSLEFLALTEENGVCLVSEFTEYIQTFNGFFCYNPFKYESFKEKLKLVVNIDKEVLREISGNDKSLLRKNSVLNWFEGIVVELKRNLRKVAISDHDLPGFSNDSILMKSIFKIAENDAFQLLEIYKSCKNRLFFFQNLNKPLFNNKHFLKKPRNHQKFPSEVMKTLEILANDPRNSLFLINDESLEVLDLAAKKIRNLGLLSEYGYFYRTDGKQRWRQLFHMDFRWKTKVLEIMKEFKRRTEKSQIFNKDSFIIWNFEGCEQELARKQAFELENLLRNELRNEINKVEVVRSQCKIEVRPFGVNKVHFY